MNLDRMQMRQLDENMVDRGNPPPFLHHGRPRSGSEGEAVGVGEAKGPVARARWARRARARTHTLTRACWPVRAEGAGTHADVLAPRRESRANKSTPPHY